MEGMGKLWRFAAVVVLLAVCTWRPGAVAQTASVETVPPEIQRVQETYQRELARIRSETSAGAQALDNNLLAAMQDLEAQSQKQGRLDELLAIRTERERFAMYRDIPPDALAEAQLPLGALQRRYLAARKTQVVTQAERVKALGSLYMQSLHELMEQLTRKGDIEQALRARQERDNVPNLPEIKAADFVLADAAVRRSEPDRSTPTSPPTPPRPAPVVTKKYAGSPLSYIAKRYDDLCRAIRDDDWSRALTFVDPSVVKKQGMSGVRPMLQTQFRFLRTVDAMGLSQRAGEITISGDNGQTARLVSMVRRGNDWRNFGSTRWVEVEGDWFIVPDDTPLTLPGSVAPERPGREGAGRRR